MPFFRVDDGLHSHRKVLKLGADHSDALALWTLAGSWCAYHLTDGWIPEYVAASLDAHYAERAKALVHVGLWEVAEQDGEPGWQFHGWSDPGRNPLAEQVTAERAATAERQRRFRERAKGTAAIPKPRTEARAEEPQEPTDSNGVTEPLVTPTFPFLSIPLLFEEPNTCPAPATPPAESETKPASKQAARKKPEPDLVGFDEFWGVYPRRVKPERARIAWAKARQRGVEAAVLIEAARRFRDHCKRISKPVNYTPHPSTWLNDGSWEDDLDAEEAPSQQPQTASGHQAFRNSTDPDAYDGDF